MLMIFMMIEDPKERTFLSRLYEEQSKHLFGIADHMLHNAADAEDAVQEVFLKLLSHKSIQQLASMQAEKREAYLIICILNQARDMLRQKKARKETELKEDMIDPASEQWEEALEKEDLLQRFLTMLNERQRDILLYHFEHHMTYREIAELTDMTPGAVQKTVSRMIGKMRAYEKEVWL